MFSGYDWTADISPIITGFLGESIVHGSISTIIGIAIAAFGAAAVLGIFFTKRG